jgi:hypothetical protein
MKTCSKCNINKSFNDFKNDATKKDGKYSSCKDCVKAYRANHYKENREKYSEKAKKNYIKNSDDYKRRAKKNHYKRMEVDIIYKLKTRFRTRIYQAFKLNNWKKNNKSSQLLGCDINIAKKHIEDRFLKGMSWENCGNWHIDHIIPLASAKTKDDLERLFHYTNLQPLWKEDNLKKASKIKTID